MFTSLLKRMIKDTDEQRDEEIHRVRIERIGVQELLSLWSLGPRVLLKVLTFRFEGFINKRNHSFYRNKQF